jgi:hypothetical protein
MSVRANNALDIISSRQITKLLVVFYNIFYIQNTTKITQCQSLKQVEKIYYLCIGIFLLRISIHISVFNTTFINISAMSWQLVLLVKASCYFFLVFLVAFTNKTSCHDIAEILMKVVLKTDI